MIFEHIYLKTIRVDPAYLFHAKIDNNIFKASAFRLNPVQFLHHTTTTISFMFTY